jgi:kynurenine formamidase
MTAPADTLPPVTDGRYAIVDLTLLLAEDLPCYWPAHLPFQHKVWNWFASTAFAAGRLHARSGPYATKWMAIDEHTGTHVDAPSHFIPPPDSGLPFAGPRGSTSVEQVPVSQTIGPAAVIDVSWLSTAPGSPGVSPLVTPEHIEQWEEHNGALSAGDVVLIRTGWDRWYERAPGGSRYVADVLAAVQPGWPAPGVEAIRLLVERGVRCVGIDAPTMGPAQGGQAVHVEGLGAGIVFVECLARLEQLPARGGWFCFLPLRIEGGTGAPGRAIAWAPVQPL